MTKTMIVRIFDALNVFFTCALFGTAFGSTCAMIYHFVRWTNSYPSPASDVIIIFIVWVASFALLSIRWETITKTSRIF